MIALADRLPPLHITENGCALDEPLADDRRIAYLESHLTALRAAMDAGVDVRGYFTWSLTDNVEWTEGASQRFGVVHIDYETLTRTPKASYAWYREMSALNQISEALSRPMPVTGSPSEVGES
ncbi:family 1 glycosylhydrolase [Streptomyces halstedii]|uniref:family 1 glycosylhydrolase n=1 Tax=Streptomyces halstedii TaxID=1944 RepID=UPI0033A614BF